MKEENKTYLTIVALIIVISFIFFFVITPFWGQIKEYPQKTGELEGEIMHAKRQAQALESFSEIYEKDKQYFERIAHISIDSKKPLDFVEFLENFSEEFNILLTISSMSSEAQETPEAYWKEMELTTEAEGSLGSFLNFLEAIENSYYLFDINSLNLEMMENDEEKEITASFSINFFVE